MKRAPGLLRDRLWPKRTAGPLPVSALAWVRVAALVVVGALERKLLRGVHGAVARDGA